MKLANIAILLADVIKEYPSHQGKPTFVEKFVKGPNETFWALKNINPTITVILLTFVLGIWIFRRESKNFDD